MPTFDAIVLGTGGVGSAALSALASRGMRALGLDRFPPGHARGSSHGQSRMIRQAYFEHPDYVPLLLRSYTLWAELEQRRGTQLLIQTGLVEVGPSDGAIVPGVLESARRYGLEVEPLSGSEIQSRWPGLNVPAPLVGVFEKRAGYLRVEECVRACADDAVSRGAELHAGETAVQWSSTGGCVTVRTDRAQYSAGCLIIAAGAWAGALLADIGLRLEVRRKPLFWYATRTDDYLVERGFPGFFYELPQGVFYGFPRIDNAGVKFAEHSGGRVVADPLLVDREIDPSDQRRVEEFASACLPGVTRHCTAHAVCMYTMTRDEHFIVDRHPAHSNVVFAAGLSGHGFKFTPVLGEVLVDLALRGSTDQPIGFLSCSRPGL
jgi:sarcosine oxidase